MVSFPSTWTPGMDAEMLRLWGEGASAREIGAVLGCSKNAVIGRHRRITPPPPPPPAPPAVTIHDIADSLVHGACRWFEGDPLIIRRDPGSVRYCGEPAVAGKSYCAAHAKVAFVPARKSEAH